MNVPDKDHPLWPLIRLGLVGAVLVLCLKYNYNGLDSRDILTVFLTLAGLGGMDVFKRTIAN